MESESFDRVARVLGAAGTRRGALAILTGAGIIGARDASSARTRRRTAGKGTSRVTAQASCGSPGPSSNLNGCDFDSANLTGANLSSSSMVGTNFQGATLVGADLSASKMNGANFKQANLCGARMVSSVLKDADARGANLTRVDARSSNCKGLLTDNRTVVCQTVDCDGKLRNDSCPGVVASAVCCQTSECPAGSICTRNRCQSIIG